LTHIYPLIGRGDLATEQEIVIASHRICYGSAAAAFFIVLQTSAFAQGSQQQRDACTPDAFRLCGAYMPDPGRVEACLRASGPNLSRPCYDVFFPPQQAPVAAPQPAGRQRRSNNPPIQLQPRPPANDDD
jgi:hypothetical protein